MHYYIDGYNYLFSTLSGGVHLKLHREALIYDLNQKASLLNLNITIVFDAQYQEGDATVTHYGNLEIIYTAEHQTADELIIKLLSKVEHPKRYLLITSDNKLSWQAKVLQVQTQATDEFITWINKKYQNKILHPHHDQEELPSIKAQASTNYIKRSLRPDIKPRNEKPKTVATSIIQTSNLNAYYESVFMEKLGKTEQAEKELKVSKKKLIPTDPFSDPDKKDSSLKPEKYETDYDRWLRIFGDSSS